MSDVAGSQARESTTRSRPLNVWVVDPINYSGMAYYDAALAQGLSNLGAEMTLIGSDRPLLEAPTSRSYDYLPLFHGTSGRKPRLLKGIRYVGGLMRLVARARRERPSIIHWQYLELPILDLAAMWVIARSGIKQVYTAHEAIPWTARRHHIAVFGQIYRLMDSVITHSDADARELRTTWLLHEDKVCVTGHGNYELFANPDLSMSEARQRVNVPMGVKVALFFGSLRPSKGLETLLDAWPRVVRAYPDALLLVAGRPYKGADGSDLVSRARRLGTEASIAFRFGEASPDDANSYFRAADVVVLPYLRVSSSAVLRYAYSSGRAVVGTATGEHASWIRPGQTGWLVPVGDPVTMAGALIDSLSDTGRLAEFGESALALSRQALDWGPIARATLEAYGRVKAGAP